MKKIFRVVLFAMATIGVVSCSSDALVESNVENNEVNENGGYAFFKIGTIGNETRATPDAGEFTEGSANEYAICPELGSNFVVFYDTNGLYHSAAYLEIAGNAVNGEEGEKTFKVTIRKDNDNIKNCLLVLNANPETLDDLRDKRLDEAKSTLDSRMGSYTYNDTKYFTMSNTVFVNANAVQSEVAIDPSKNFCKTPEEAAKNAITVYVERVLSKFTVNYAGNAIAKAEEINPFENEDSKAETVTVFTKREGNDFQFEQNKEWTVVIDGWGVNATETATNLFKNLGDRKFGNWNADYTTTTIGWNDATRHRSYWAVDPHYDTTDKSLYPEQFRTAEDVISAQSAAGDFTTVKAGLPLNYYSYNQLNGNEAQRYAAENTFNASDWLTNSNVSRAATHIIVAAKLKIDGQAAQTVYNFNRVYWFEEDVKDLQAYMMKQVVSRWKVEKGAIYVDADHKTELGTNIKDAEDYFELVAATVKNGDGRQMLQFTGEALYDKNGKEVSLDEFKKYINEWGTARKFTGGCMYYAIPIKHMVAAGEPAAKYEVGSYGVVRNHWYKANINAINKPGIPVDNPDQPIIPNDDPDEDGYASFEIVIIPWHVVNWDIEL